MLVSFAGVDRISLENREFGLYLQLRRTITRASTGVSFAAIWMQVLAHEGCHVKWPVRVQRVFRKPPARQKYASGLRAHGIF